MCSSVVINEITQRPGSSTELPAQTTGVHLCQEDAEEVTISLQDQNQLNQVWSRFKTALDASNCCVTVLWGKDYGQSNLGIHTISIHKPGGQTETWENREREDWGSVIKGQMYESGRSSDIQAQVKALEAEITKIDKTCQFTYKHSRFNSKDPSHRRSRGQPSLQIERFQQDFSNIQSVESLINTIKQHPLFKRLLENPCYGFVQSDPAYPSWRGKMVLTPVGESALMEVFQGFKKIQRGEIQISKEEVFAFLWMMMIFNIQIYIKDEQNPTFVKEAMHIYDPTHSFKFQRDNKFEQFTRKGLIDKIMSFLVDKQYPIDQQTQNMLKQIFCYGKWGSGLQIDTILSFLPSPVFAIDLPPSDAFTLMRSTEREVMQAMEYAVVEEGASPPLININREAFSPTVEQYTILFQAKDLIEEKSETEGMEGYITSLKFLCNIVQYSDLKDLVQKTLKAKETDSKARKRLELLPEGTKLSQKQKRERLALQKKQSEAQEEVARTIEEAEAIIASKDDLCPWKQRGSSDEPSSSTTPQNDLTSTLHTTFSTLFDGDSSSTVRKFSLDQLKKNPYQLIGQLLNHMHS